MKQKHWLAVVLSVGLVALAAQEALAWKCCKNCGVYLCCRPYNAFSPCCFGSICCDGCCPVQNMAYRPCGPACGMQQPFAPPLLCPPSLVPPGGDCGCGSPLAGYPGAGYPGAGYPGAGYPGAGYPGAGYPGAGPAGPYMLPPPPYSNPQPNFGFPPPPPTTAWTPPAAGPNGAAQYARGVYPGFYPNYPMGYWTTAYAPSPYGNWGVPPQGR